MKKVCMYRRKKINRVRLASLPGNVTRGIAAPSWPYYLEMLFEVLFNYPIAWLGSRRYRRDFDRIDCYCMFIGYPRSGHSLVAALLDAHPEAVCAAELGALKYLHAGYSKHQLFYLLMKNAQLQEISGQYTWGYQYRVTGQYQGAWKQPKVIGDKLGSGATMRLKARPWLLNRLRRVIGTDIRFIHIVRNPFDNIRSIAGMYSLGLDDSIGYYFSLCDSILELKKRISGSELIEFRYEDFIASPASHLLRLCRSFDLSEHDAYISACCAVVWPEPRLASQRSQWSDGQIRRVRDGVRRIPYLSGYTYG